MYVDNGQMYLTERAVHQTQHRCNRAANLDPMVDMMDALTDPAG